MEAWWGSGGRGRGGRHCLAVSREDRDHKQGPGALRRPGNQPRGRGGGSCWQEGQGLPRPLHRPMVNGHCVRFPAVAASSARTLVFLPQPEASPLIRNSDRGLAVVLAPTPTRAAAGGGDAEGGCEGLGRGRGGGEKAEDPWARAGLGPASPSGPRGCPGTQREGGKPPSPTLARTLPVPWSPASEREGGPSRHTKPDWLPDLMKVG